MDASQLTSFCHYMVGDRMLGGSNPDDPIGAPHSPELRAFIEARLGDNMSIRAYQLIIRPGRTRSEWHTAQARALAALLREVADGIDPPDAGAKEPA